jgi:DNA polymerase-3 subunit delta'
MSDLGDLKKILYKKYLNNNLGSVYLAKYPDQTEPKVWAEEFLKEITPLADHPDVLWVNRTESENEYKVDSPGIKALINFLNYRAYELKKKFIFINDAHLLSVIVSNKLLKIFEELPENFCLFLFAPQSQTLLPTVESRAIKILMPRSFNTASLNSDIAHYGSAQELVASLKKSDDDFNEEKDFIEDALNRTLKSGHFIDCQNILEDLKHYGVSENFNNSKLSRLSLFFK